MDVSLKMFSEIPSVVRHHWNAGNLNWPMGIYITLVHVVGFVGVAKIMECSKETLMWAFVLWPISGFGITVGVHRLWSHRSYSASFPVRFFLMLCNSIANQGSIYHWARDHRVHHKYSETDADPHNAMRGFFFAHMGWLYLKKHPEVIRAGKELDFSDLHEDPVVMFQKKLDPWFALYMCFVFPAQIAVKFWGESFWPAFFVAGGLRYMIVLHFTWFVNSAAHLHGDHPYDVVSYPAENPFVSFFAVGEGWHNWHHKYPFDYAVGLVWGRKRGTAAWDMGRERRERDREAGVPLPKPAPRPWEATAAAKQD